MIPVSIALYLIAAFLSMLEFFVPDPAKRILNFAVLFLAIGLLVSTAAVVMK